MNYVGKVDFTVYLLNYPRLNIKDNDAYLQVKERYKCS